MTLRDRPKFDDYGYWPNTPSQWREPTVDDCTWYAGEFAFQAADSLHRNYHPVNDIRNQSTDRDGGTPVDVMLRDTKQFWPKDAGLGYEYAAWKKRDIVRALNTGATVVTGGDYEKLPLHYRRWTNNDYFNHAMAHRFARKNKVGKWLTALYDPLGGGPTREPYDGEWILLDALYGDEDEYTWRKSAGRYWVGVVDNYHGKDQMKRVFFDKQDTQRECQVFTGSPVYAEPTTIAPKLKVLMDDQKWYGLIGRVNPDWFAVFSWNKELNDHEVGYLAAQDVKTLRRAEPQQYASDDEHELIISTLQMENNELRSRAKTAESKVEGALPLLNSLVDTLS